MTKPPKPMEQIFAFVADDFDGVEGIVGMPFDGKFLPLVGADTELMEKLRPVAHEIAEHTGKEVRLVRFIKRVDLGKA